MASQNPDSTNATSGLPQRLNRMIAGASPDFNSWRLLISEIERESPEDINTLSLAYDSLLSMFPLCHWHLEKYARQKAKLCSSHEALNLYDQVMEAAKYSVGFWVDYFTFAAACFGNPEDVRRLFGRAISFVGKDYFCHVLWDKYMKYEFNQERWSFLAQSYIQVLRFPTKKLQFYYDKMIMEEEHWFQAYKKLFSNFKQFVANLEEEMGYNKNNSIEEHAFVPCTATDLSKDEISIVIKDMLDSSSRHRSLKSKALDKYRSIGEEFYLEARQRDEKIKGFEKKILRRYFDVIPLDDNQLSNWHQYLDFIEKEDNLDSAMQLYERCLIPCANYPEFWMRYVDFLESKGGRELAITTLARATQVFLKNVPEIHLFNSRYKEHIGDINDARVALVACDTETDSSFIRNITIQANLERRLGNFAAASAIYEKSLKKARECQKLQLLPSLYSHFARLTFLMTGSASDAKDVLIEGIREVPHCRFLLEELIKFAMTHEGTSYVNIIDSIIGDAISPGLVGSEGLNAKDQENISCLFLEFVDLCGTTHDIRKAWNRHFKLFPQSLRVRTPYKHSTPDGYSMDLARDIKGNNQPSRNTCYQGRELVLPFPLNNETNPYWVVGNTASQKYNSKNSKETVQEPWTKVVASSNDNESQDQRSEGGPGPMVVCAQLPEQVNERNSDQGRSYLHSRGEKLGPTGDSTELGIHSKEKSLSSCEAGESTEAIEASCASLIPVQPELGRELKQQKLLVSFDNVSSNSQERESAEIHPLQVCTESKRDESVSHQHNIIQAGPEEPFRTGENSIVTDGMVPAPGHTASGFEEQNPAGQKSSRSELGAVPEDRTTEAQSTTTPWNNMPAGQAPIYYPQQNTLSGQNPWQAQQSLSMLQYQYHEQQQLLQQQYQQQLDMQNTYFQHYMSQQPHQSSTQQQSQQTQSLNFQQGQYSQPQDLASYQAYQQQQLLWQQYQQYHHQQQQSREGSVNMLQEHHQQAHSQLNSTHQSQKGGMPDHDGASGKDGF